MTDIVTQINVNLEDLQRVTPVGQALLWQIPRGAREQWSVVRSPLQLDQPPTLATIVQGDTVPVLLLPYLFNPDGASLLAFGLCAGAQLPAFQRLVVVVAVPFTVTEERLRGYVGVAFMTGEM